MATKKVICFGEVLWDMLPTGKMPGGAPMNVAFHLNNFGLDAAIISRIGTDEPGSDILAFMQTAGLDTTLVQHSPDHPTGVVKVNMEDSSEVSYEIVQPVAWDYIQLDENALDAVKTCDCFVFGSLAARSATSRETLYQLINKAPFKVFDVNFRDPHYTREVVEYLLRAAHLVKMNAHELAQIHAWNHTPTDEKTAVRDIADRYQVPTVCVTRGGSGALLLKEGEFYESKGFAVQVNDTIGSGDSFLAALLNGILKNEPAGQTLEFACAVGSLVATYRGATPSLSEEEIRQIQREGMRVG